MTNCDIYKLESVKINTYKGKLRRINNDDVESYNESEKKDFEKLKEDNFYIVKGNRTYIYLLPAKPDEDIINKKTSVFLFDYRKKQVLESSSTLIIVVKVNRKKSKKEDEEDVYEFEIDTTAENYKPFTYETGEDIKLVRRVDANNNYFMFEIEAKRGPKYY